MRKECDHEFHHAFYRKNAIVKADSIQYNALHDGKVTEYHLESITKPNGPEMRALRGPDLSMVFQDPMSSLNPVYKVGDQVAEGLLQHNKGMKKQKQEKKFWKCSANWESRTRKSVLTAILISSPVA